jgi:hypothetical protein
VKGRERIAALLTAALGTLQAADRVGDVLKLVFAE